MYHGVKVIVTHVFQYDSKPVSKKKKRKFSNKKKEKKPKIKTLFSFFKKVPQS